MLKNKPFWFSIALITAYLLTGFLAVPHWLQPRLEQYVKLHLGRQLQFEKLQFDPLTWSAELTEVRLAVAENGTADEQGLFPGIELTSESVHLRFNFWGLHAAVSTLIVRAPVLTVDGDSMLMQSGRYPFVSQWQRWNSIDSKNQERFSVPIQRWQLESGRVMLAYPEAQKAEMLLLDELRMEADQANEVGQREFQLDFTPAVGSAISMHGQLHLSSLSSSGKYKWEAALPREEQSGFQRTGMPVGVNTEINAVGEFSLSTQGDGLLIELTQSQLSSNQAERCVLNGLMCVRIFPLNASFSVTLRASTGGFSLLNAQLQQAEFELDASLGQGAVLLNDRLMLESARLQIKGLPESPDRTAEQQSGDSMLEFNLALQTAGEPQEAVYVNMLGQFHPQSEQVRMRFSTRGEPDLRGEMNWHWMAADASEAAYPQLELRLENPAASLADSFITEHLSGQVAAAALRWELTAMLKERELWFSENIRLQQVSASDVPHSEPALDAAWLLALLQNPQSDVELNIPEQGIALTEQRSLQDLLEAPILAYLDQISAQPFDSLARQMGEEGKNLAKVQFESGSAELTASSSENLTLLAAALQQRPGLGVKLAGVYDPLIDKKVLQTEQIRTHIALATAAELAFRSGSEPPDFSDPTVHSVIDEFARRRLPTEVINAFVRHFGEADADSGVKPEGDIAGYYAILFEMLVDYADIPQEALSTLARYRAQAVINLLSGQGVSSDRLEAASEPLTTAAELDGVPLHLHLSIHPSGNPELLEDSSPGF